MSKGVSFTSRDAMWDGHTIHGVPWPSGALREAIGMLNKIQNELPLFPFQFTINSIADNPWVEGWAGKDVINIDIYYRDNGGTPGLIAHEFAHIIDPLIGYFGLPWSQSASAWLDATSWAKGYSEGKPYWYYKDPTSMRTDEAGHASSPYAGQHNPSEDFAETFKWYMGAGGLQPSIARQAALSVALDKWK